MYYTHADWLKVIYHKSMEIYQKIFCRFILKEIESFEFFPSFHRLIVTLVKVWEDSKQLWKHLSMAVLPLV